MTETDPRYPVGRFVPPTEFTAATRSAAIESIAAMPARLRNAVSGLTDAQLDTPYRTGGWTLRQVAHHLADAHLNGYTRTRLALTEDNPTVRPYEQVPWAELSDAKSLPLEPSLKLLEGLHERWVALLRSLTPADFARPLHHPEVGALTVDLLVADYEWEGRHHVAHITEGRRRNGW